MFRAACTLAVCLLCLVPVQAPRAQDELELDLQAAELPGIVDRIAAFTGRRFLYDDRLRGRVSVAVPRRVDRREAIELLHAALLIAGFVALPGPGDVLSIVPLQESAGRTPWIVREPDARSGGRVATLIPLRRVEAGEMVSALRPLVGDAGLIVAYQPTNSLIVATTEARLRRLLQLLRGLDDAAERELRVVGVRYRDPENVAALTGEALRSDAPGRGEVRMIPDVRTSSLILEGPRDDVREAERLVRLLDVPRPGRGDLHVVRILNAVASDVAERLEALHEGDGPAALAGADYQVVVDEPTHSLVIRALPETFEELAALIAEIDVPAPRVAVRMQVIEVSTRGNLTLGFDSLLPLSQVDALGDTVIVAGTGSRASSLIEAPLFNPPQPQESFVARATHNPVVIPVVDPITGNVTPVAIGGGVQVRAEAGEARFDSIVEPFLMMISGEEHRIVAGDNVPVPVSSGGAETSELVTSLSIERRDTGVDLRITPNVLSDGAVRVAIELEVSDVGPGSIPEQGPTISQQQVSVDALLRDGEALMIAGLRSAGSLESTSGVPWLKDLPFLGWFFRTTVIEPQRRYLIVIAEATVMRSPAEDLAFSVHRRLASERERARARALQGLTDAPWALLVTTRSSEAGAREVADGIAAGAGEPRVVPWTWDGRQRFDVYLTGFGSVAGASRKAVELRAASWMPQLVPVMSARR